MNVAKDNIKSIKEESDYSKYNLWNLDDTEGLFPWIYHRKESKVLFSVLCHLKNSNFIQIDIDADRTLCLPKEYEDLYGVIVKSKKILEYPDNWDDEGSKAYNLMTWGNTIVFLINYANWSYDHFNIILPTPQILPGPLGSIDLYWENEEYELLVTIPENLNNNLKFYGDNKKDTKIKGEFDFRNYKQSVFLSLLSYIK